MTNPEPYPADLFGVPRQNGEARTTPEACAAVFQEWLHLPDAGALYVTLAAVAANRAEGDPVWLLVVGPPGGGKTEIINAISHQPDVHPAATLTEGALLSGVPKRDRVASSKGGLLRTIGAFGIILLKDFGSVLSMHRETRGEVLAALREVFDGSWTRHVGTDGGQTLSWSGKVGLIAGCTPAIDSHHAVIGSMGERFVLYRLPPTDADAQVRRAMRHVGREAAMRAALAEAVGGVLAGVDHRHLTAPADDEITERLVAISTLAVRCRSAVERDGFTREVTLIPEAEAPARLALVLLRLLRGLQAIGVDDGTAWQIVTKCALDSMPAVRRTLLEDLIVRTGPASTAEVATSTDYPTTTTRRGLEDLAAHGIVVRQALGTGKPDLWRVSDWARGRWPTVPEMSQHPNTTLENGEIGANPLPIYVPVLTFDDFSGTPLDDDYPPSATEVD